MVVFLIARKVILSKDTREKGLRVFLGFACLLLYLILAGPGTWNTTGEYLDLWCLTIYGVLLAMIEAQKGRSEYFREKRRIELGALPSEHYRENNSPG